MRENGKSRELSPLHLKCRVAVSRFRQHYPMAEVGSRNVGLKVSRMPPGRVALSTRGGAVWKDDKYERIHGESSEPFFVERM